MMRSLAHRFVTAGAVAPASAVIRRAALASALAPASASAYATAGALPFQRRRFSVESFTDRHVGPCEAEVDTMLKVVGSSSAEELATSIVPAKIRRPPMPAEAALTEAGMLRHLRELMAKNKMAKSLIGQGFAECIVPPAVQRNVFENPGWYTPYTPYQAEISQGRLEALLNFQSAVAGLTAMDIANSSLLDESTAASEAMMAAVAQGRRKKRNAVFVDAACFPATIDMLQMRAAPLGIEVIVGDAEAVDMENPKLAGVIVQSPDATGAVRDFTDLFGRAKAKGVVSACGTDLLACAMVKPPGEMGADIAFGTAQRLGVPLGFGGPHPAFFAVRDGPLRRLLPGRLIGVSKDRLGGRCLRMALQTREQHIKREHATSNICTAQALLATMSSFYCVFHGPGGLKEIALRTHMTARAFALGATMAGHSIAADLSTDAASPAATLPFFDTVAVELNPAKATAASFARECERRRVNVHVVSSTRISVSFDEATRDEHLQVVLEAAGLEQPDTAALRKIAQDNFSAGGAAAAALRSSSFMTEEVFNTHHSETELMRYAWRLQRRDYGLQNGMVPLGSCTMKLNPAASMLPLSWVRLNSLHPYAPADQSEGYQLLALALEKRLCEISGFDAVSLQPNSGAQGEYAGLRVIRSYLDSVGEGHRDVCLIPANAHGTNPASAHLAGLKILTLRCLPNGCIDMDHLREVVSQHGAKVAAAMITYPSTYGIFDRNIVETTDLIHSCGAQVYIDGANFNAMVGYTGPGFFGGDVCHFNLHKTFSIPHGGGGPGMGPIGVRAHLAPFLPRGPAVAAANGLVVGGARSVGPVSQAPYGSASILPISYALMAMLGTDGLRRCTEVAVLAANYMCKRIGEHFPILYVDENGHCGHEFIVDLRPFKKIGIEAEDVAKRLMDYGFHAPTLAFPVQGTLMIEPTESEPMTEMDRFIDAMAAIRAEIRKVEAGEWPRDDNPLVNAPHPQGEVVSTEWRHCYSRETAAFPSEYTRSVDKFWPTTARVDGEFGDLNLFCSCAPVPDTFVAAAAKTDSAKPKPAATKQ